MPAAAATGIPTPAAGNLAAAAGIPATAPGIPAATTSAFPTSIPPNTLNNTLSQIPVPTSSPAPSDDSVDISKYLHFCHVDPTDEALKKALEKYGIDHYSGFKHFKPEELESEGVKKSHARLLVGSIKKFACHLRRPQEQLH
ncbi:hypothetical protein PTTG_02896 [Puccinia triticina 1-1 BBBD Race 1]|uniref:SAM domain-containing protein n=1 Tax=Puccinia triticina (isolate 1-1 / race 1 (BBBD)) TaxID=630390 RepID=A0A0C4EQ41_PUCT1|nr:hypothetical protein PTTG_02896 [Puccinia triticina 1-1 BBBD Race 1]